MENETRRMETRGDGVIWCAMMSVWRNCDVREKRSEGVISRIVNVNREQIRERNKQFVEYCMCVCEVCVSITIPPY